MTKRTTYETKSNETNNANNLINSSATTMIWQQETTPSTTVQLTDAHRGTCNYLCNTTFPPEPDYDSIYYEWDFRTINLHELFITIISIMTCLYPYIYVQTTDTRKVKRKGHHKHRKKCAKIYSPSPNRTNRIYSKQGVHQHISYRYSSYVSAKCTKLHVNTRNLQSHSITFDSDSVELICDGGASKCIT